MCGREKDDNCCNVNVFDMYCLLLCRLEKTRSDKWLSESGVLKEKKRITDLLRYIIHARPYTRQSPVEFQSDEPTSNPKIIISPLRCTFEQHAKSNLGYWRFGRRTDINRNDTSDIIENSVIWMIATTDSLFCVVSSKSLSISLYRRIPAVFSYCVRLNVVNILICTDSTHNNSCQCPDPGPTKSSTLSALECCW